MLALSLNSASLAVLALLASFGGAAGADCLGGSFAGLPPASGKQPLSTKCRHMQRCCTLTRLMSTQRTTSSLRKDRGQSPTRHSL